MPVTVELTQELEARLRREAARHGLDAEAYIARALEQHLRAARDADDNGAAPLAALPAREAELLQRINAGLPADTWARYHDLVRRRTTGTLTEPEQGELIALSDRIEEANADRIARVVELARLRGVTPDALVRELGLPGGSRA
jgi:hypothetical protein